jgi:hypothetical protein
VTKIRCAVCGSEVFKDKHGRVLRHTTIAMGGERPAKMAMFDPGLPYIPAEVCKGSDPGARP